MSRFRRMLLSNQGTEYNLDDIMMTSESNPEVMKICYINGFAKHKDYMTYREAADVTDTAAFNTAFNNSNIKYFNEAKYFTGITGTVSFTANYLKCFVFPPNCEVSISGRFPLCDTYDLGMWDGDSLPNGSQNFHNKYVKNVIINPNNRLWKLIHGWLGKGQFVKKAYLDSNTFRHNTLWLVADSSKDIIFPFEEPNNYTSVSVHFSSFNGNTIVSNNMYAGNVAFTNGGQNLRKIVSFYNTSYEYSPYHSGIASNVSKDVKREFIVNANDPQNFENNPIYTNYLLNPNYSNFELKRTNFAITIYHNELLELFNGLYKDEYFMTQEECAMLTSLENRLQNSKIDRFREFKYFIGLENIEENSFKNCINMKDIFLPNNIKRIESNAFLNCKKLLEITIPASVEYIGENAFAGCEMLSVIKFEGLNAPEIHSNAFGTNDNIVGKLSNCHSILLPQINSGYEIILSKLTNYNKVAYLDELDLTGLNLDTGVKWTDKDELFYKTIFLPTNSTQNLISNIGFTGWGQNGYVLNSSNGAALNIYTSLNYTGYLKNNDNRTFYIDVCLNQNKVIIDTDVNLLNGRWFDFLRQNYGELNNTIIIGNTQLFKEYRQLDSNGMPKWWGYPYQNSIIKGIYDVVNNKNYKLITEEQLINKTTFIETQGDIAQYIDTGRLIKDTDTVYLRMLYCLVLSDLIDVYTAMFGYRISGLANSSKNQIVLTTCANGKNSTTIFFRKGSGTGITFANNLSDRIKPQTYIITPSDVIYNNLIQDDTLHTNQCFINGTSVINPHIFGINNAGSNFQSISKMRVFEYSIVDKDNNTVLQLLPFVDDNGKACLKDEISGELFYDENGADLIYGEYIEKVRIIDVDNVLYTSEQYLNLSRIQELTPVGVYVKTNEAEFIIAPRDANDGQLTSWGCNGLTIEGTTPTTERYLAISDINGYNNTQNILIQSQGYIDSNNITGAPIAESCNNFVFNNNERGYLPSLGELVIAYKLKTEINQCLNIIGSTFKSDYYASSTRYNIGANRWDLRWSDGNITNYNSDGKWYVRPFTKVVGEVVDYIPGAATIPYIQSDGENYQSIDTKYILQSTDEIFIDFHILNDGLNNSTTWFLLFGWRSTGNYNGTTLFGVEHQSPGHALYIFYGKSSSGGYSTSTAYERNCIHVVPTQNKMSVNGVNLNNNKFDVNAPYVDGTSVVAPYLFDGNVTSKDKWAIRTMRLYSYWVKDKDGNYKIHLLPHIDENGKVCLKDQVSGECFYDTNGNDFTYGEEII